MDGLYHTIIAGVLLAASPFWLVRCALQPRFRRELAARLWGWKRLYPPPGALWIHAASVGEVRLAATLIHAIKESLPQRPVVLSTFTPAGWEVAQREAACDSFLLPPDSPLFLGPLLDRFRPAALVLLEAELWPGLLRLCRARGLPVILLNGRMSRTSFLRYEKIKPVFQWLTEGVLYFAMRSEDDARRVRRLGVAECRVGATGNMKYDALAEAPAPAQADPPWVVFGSTRPGDEEAALEAIRQLREGHPRTWFALAPRHLERVEEVAALLEDRGLDYVRHSQGALETNGEGGVVLVDQLGVLPEYYRRAQVAYVGGGFRPEFGGQNILEPAALGVPVLYGPHMNNFQEEARLLKDSGGGLQLDSSDQLTPMLRFLLEHPEERAQLGRQAAEAVRSQRGAVRRNLEILREALKFAPGS